MSCAVTDDIGRSACRTGMSKVTLVALVAGMLTIEISCSEVGSVIADNETIDANMILHFWEQGVRKQT